MNPFVKFGLAAAMTVATAFGNQHLTQIRDQAAVLEREFRDMSATIKSKSFDPAALSNRLAEIDTNLDKLKSLTTEFESANPHFGNLPEWKTAKDVVTLLDLFHERKAELLKSDARQQRARLKAHAEGLAHRSAILREAAGKLLRAMPPSGS